jgi:hypothetical protein
MEVAERGNAIANQKNIVKQKNIIKTDREKI